MYSLVHPCTSVACVLNWFQTYSKLLRRLVWNVYVWRILYAVDVMKISYNQYLIYHISKYISKFSNYSEPPHTHSQKSTILVLSRCYATDFTHMCGGGSIRATLRTRKSAAYMQAWHISFFVLSGSE